MSVDAKSYDEALARLTGPGSLFELRIEDVRGRPMRNFARRPKSLSELVVQAARHGERDFLIQGDRRISYAEFAQLVSGTALRFRGAGLEKGDRLAILAYNSLDYALCVFAAASLGSIAVPLNGWWVEAEIEHALRDSGSRFLMVDERLHRRVRKLLGGIEGLETVFFSGDAPPQGTRPLRDMIAAHAELNPLAEVCEDDPFAILYTSGTTGRPKGCVTTHRGTITQVMGIVLHAMLAGALGEAGPLPSDGSQPTSLMT